MATKSERTAIVTGASRGIGAAVAQRLAADGFAVVVNYAGQPEEAEGRVAAIRKAGGVARAVRADVSDAAAVRAMFDEAQAAYGGVDILVNNAGIMQLASLAEADDAFSKIVLVTGASSMARRLWSVRSRLRLPHRVK